MAMELPLLEPVYWNWLAAGLAFISLEILVPGVFFMWIGFAAMGTAMTCLVFPLSWEIQWLSFAAYSLLSLGIWYRFFKTGAEKTDAPLLNQRVRQYVGRTVTLDQPVVDGMTSIRLDDSRWRMRLPDGAVGDRARIIDADGTVLIGEKLEG